MILIDSRVGSNHLAKPLKRRGLPVELTTLKYGDLSFAGRGPRGGKSIGVELKTITDLLACIQSKRFTGGQLPGLVADYDVVYLIVEGGFRAGSDGVLELPRGGGEWRAWGSRGPRGARWARPMMYRDLLGFLTSVETLAGVRVRRTITSADTVECVASLYSWWSKPWSAHHSTHAIYDGERSAGDTVVPITRASFARTIAAQLPGIGWKKSAAVVNAMPTVEDMVMASRKDWARVDGVGKTLSERIYTAIHMEVSA